MELQVPFSGIFAIMSRDFIDDLRLERALLHLLLLSLKEIFLDLQHLLVVAASIHDTGLIQLAQLGGDQVGKRIDVWLELAALDLFLLF